AEQVVARERLRNESTRLETNANELQSQVDELNAIVKTRQVERQQLQVLLATARRELDERRQGLSEEEQQQVAAAAESRELRAELEQLEAQRETLEADGARPIALEHLPTPLAKTVFGHEEHFRLKGGRLVYVPLNELTDLLKAELPNKVWRLKDVPEFTETIGPVQGFHLQYTMIRRDVTATTQAGPVVRQLAELDQFVLLPLSEEIGETIAEALADNSQFRQLLETLRPGATVVTVWTYPDSYAEFRQVKKWLFQRGFASAARPLPEDQPITGSPNGSRSAAQ
ncbi:MAG: hypothetical protein KDB23_09785, partial [Planctomycetales bacterium]|nr:hypothetical protein [Planctomycetales bacterium]